MLLVTAHHLPGGHQGGLLELERYLVWCGWWVGLGVLSSVGLGTGLHTFLLYLGRVVETCYTCAQPTFSQAPT